MKILKIVCTTLLCAGVIALGAFLPKLTSAFWDSQTGEVAYADMEPISLEIRELTMLEKLGCFTDPTVVYLPEYNAQIKAEELYNVIALEMQPYQNAGIINYEIDFADEKNWYMEYELAMYYNSFAPDKNNLFWLINLSSDAYMQSNLQIVLDDSTGAIMLIEFQTEYPFYSPNIPFSVLERFYTVYFDRLGVPIESLDAVELEPISLSESSMCMEFGWQDETYGAMRLNFQVYEKGFFVSLV